MVTCDPRQLYIKSLRILILKVKVAWPVLYSKPRARRVRIWRSPLPPVLQLYLLSPYEPRIRLASARLTTAKSPERSPVVRPPDKPSRLGSDRDTFLFLLRGPWHCAGDPTAAQYRKVSNIPPRGIHHRGSQTSGHRRRCLTDRQSLPPDCERRSSMLIS